MFLNWYYRNPELILYLFDKVKENSKEPTSKAQYFKEVDPSGNPYNKISNSSSGRIENKSQAKIYDESSEDSCY